MLRQIRASYGGVLRQSARPQCVTVRHSSSSPIPNEDLVLGDQQDITDPVMKWIESEGEVGPLDIDSIIDPPLQALPIERKPIHLTMSTLLVRAKSEPRSSTLAVPLSYDVFGQNLRRDILHACVVYHLDGLRQGTASTKTRAEVSGSNRKIRPQKGTGRARLGDIRSPSIRGGGTAFGPKPRDFKTLLPRKVRELGMRIALSAKLRDGQLGAVSTLEWPTPKTKSLRIRVGELGWTDRTLFLTGKNEIPEALNLASRNIPTLLCQTAANATVYDVLRWKRVILDIEAIEWFERELGFQQKHGLVVPLESRDNASDSATSETLSS
ncbi:50S ribosomal protein L4 OS=Desulfatibacillum alkenivorans (strain AK-01) GN=rplD PE=3 SV=1 [Rhizoctonia solani AG-1 IB]|uniref:Large ribosomal subunit protein uL4m n=2 Tax=Thanatephorus cucumeris (strain AG1-IB / isolate 7/3/14) TaxID=1108050 RepID=A0A0B7FKS9_THACB|nr:50S ribosomal protein L4 OS=Desulfatibacillum alkenivorans (strain AK-01) GN=rplD PE=3 SV=1 [Rhizoctonia solani AG-1 IB]